MRSLHAAAPQQAGGNRLSIIDNQDADTKRQASDEIWIRHIKAALMENRFRLMQQPIASLLGEDRGMFDVLVRMIDEQGQELLPAEFMAAAERNDLMKHIDRWIIGAAMSFCASRPVKQLFVRLSQGFGARQVAAAMAVESAQGNAHRCKSNRVPSERASRNGISGRHDGTREWLAQGRLPVRARALRHRPRSEAPALSPASQLHQSRRHDDARHCRSIRTCSNACANSSIKRRAKQVGTIAERVQDANTMAVLWQLGIEFIQGYFVNEPEEVVMG